MSKKNQLFKIVPDKHILNLLLEAFGLESLEDSRFFTKQNMIECDTLEKILEMKGELESYYIPCKRKVYLEKVTVDGDHSYRLI